MEDLSLWIYIAMFGVAFVAGFVDAIAGGGGLITIPMLMAVGLPAHAALATNKFQALWGTAMASWHFARSGLLDFKAIIIPSLWVFVCSGGVHRCADAAQRDGDHKDEFRRPGRPAVRDSERPAAGGMDCDYDL